MTTKVSLKKSPKEAFERPSDPEANDIPMCHRASLSVFLSFRKISVNITHKLKTKDNTNLFYLMYVVS